jgi:hypothetical protein
MQALPPLALIAIERNAFPHPKPYYEVSSLQAKIKPGRIRDGSTAPVFPFPLPVGRVSRPEGVKGLMIDLAPRGPEDKKLGRSHLQPWRAGVCSTEPLQTGARGFLCDVSQNSGHEGRLKIREFPDRRPKVQLVPGTTLC